MQVRAAGYLATSDSVTMVGGKREDRSYRLQREAVAVAPPPPAPARDRAAGDGDAEAGRDAAPAPAVAAAAPPPAPAPDARRARGVDHRDARARSGGDHSSLRPVAWGVGIGAGVGLIFGAVEGVVAIKKKNEFNDHMGPDPNDPFGSARITDCSTTAPTPRARTSRTRRRARGRCRSSGSSRAACSRAARRCCG